MRVRKQSMDNQEKKHRDWRSPSPAGLSKRIHRTTKLCAEDGAGESAQSSDGRGLIRGIRFQNWTSLWEVKRGGGVRRTRESTGKMMSDSGALAPETCGLSLISGSGVACRASVSCDERVRGTALTGDERRALLRGRSGPGPSAGEMSTRLGTLS